MALPMWRSLVLVLWLSLSDRPGHLAHASRDEVDMHAGPSKLEGFPSAVECKEDSTFYVSSSSHGSPNLEADGRFTGCTPEATCGLAETLEAMSKWKESVHCVSMENEVYHLPTALSIWTSVRFVGKGATLLCDGVHAGIVVRGIQSALHIEGVSILRCGPAIEFAEESADNAVVLERVTVDQSRGGAAARVSGSGNKLELQLSKVQRAETDRSTEGTLEIRGPRAEVLLHGSAMLDNQGGSAIHIGSHAEHTTLLLSDDTLVAGQTEDEESNPAHGIEVDAPNCTISIRNSSIANTTGAGLRLRHHAAVVEIINGSVSRNGLNGIQVLQGSADIHIKESSKICFNKLAGIITEASAVDLDISNSRFEGNQDRGICIFGAKNPLKSRVRIHHTDFVRNFMDGLLLMGTEVNEVEVELEDVKIEEHGGYGIFASCPMMLWDMADVTTIRNAGGGARFRGHLARVNITSFSALSNRGPGLEVEASTGVFTSAGSEAVIRKVRADDNSDGLRFDVEKIVLEDINVSRSRQGIRVENATTTAKMQGIRLEKNGEGLSLQRGAQAEIADMTLASNFRGLVVCDRSKVNISLLKARQNHEAISVDASSVVLTNIWVTDNLKGITFNKSAGSQVDVSPDSYIYLNQLSDIQCESSLSTSSSWFLKDVWMWLVTGWSSCGTGFYSWRTWILAVPYARAENYVIIATLLFCAGMNIPPLLPDAEEPQQGGRSTQDHAQFHVVAGLAVLFMTVLFLWYCIAFIEFFGGKGLKTEEAYRYTSSPGAFLGNLSRHISAGILVGVALCSALQNLRNRPITRKEAWSTLARSTPERQEQLRQQLLSQIK